MGAGASSSVKTVQINSSKENDGSCGNDEARVQKESRNRSGKLRKIQLGQSSTEESELREKNGNTGIEELNVTELKQQLATAESEKLDLLDRINLLEGQIEYLNTQHVLERQRSNCEETLHAKDQYISKLEREAITAEDNLAKLKIKHKRKVKSLSTQIAEVKQETSIKLLELRDEINRLTEENLRLHEKLRICKTPRLDGMSDPPNAFDDGRSKLILELSQQLNEQNDRIEELEKTLQERDKTIEELQISNQLQKKQTVEKCQVDTEQEQDSDMTELKSVLAEMKSAQRESKKQKNCVRRIHSEIKDSYRGSSGKSLDSGLGSPGEPQNQLELRKDRPESSTSTLSGLSVNVEADATVCLRTEQNKAHSAPASQVRGRPPLARTPHPPVNTHSDQWQNDSDTNAKSIRAKRKKKFSLKQRIEQTRAEDKPCTKLNSFIDSDCDIESEILLDSFRKDPWFNVDTTESTQPPPLGSIIS